ncbi:restriction endonuclease subunit S [Aeromonas veronii]
MAEQMIQHKEGEKVATQAIPTGYKQTEVGVIPKDWEVMLVGDSFTVCNNLRLPISSKVRDGMSGSYPYYGPTKIQGYINEYRVEGEFALIGEDGDHFLKFDSVNQTQLVSGKFNVNNHAHLIKGNVGSAKWFYWFFRNRDISIYLTRQGAGRFKLNKASLERIQCAIPPTEEQLAIATVLSDSDALIVSLGQLIAKKQAIKTAAMQQLLTGRTRLPQFALRPDGTPKGYKTSELGQIPEDWEAISLSALCDVRDGTHDSPKYQENGIPLVTSKNIVEDILDLSQVSLISVEDALEINKRSKVDKGDIIMSMIGTVGSAVLLIDEPLFCIKNVALFKPRRAIGSYLVQVIRSQQFQKKLEDSMDGGIQKFVSLGTLRSMEIVLPSSDEQTAIATILSDIDSELNALEQKLAKARDVKQGMMQQLLTGRIRLPLEVVA